MERRRALMRMSKQAVDPLFAVDYQTIEVLPDDQFVFHDKKYIYTDMDISKLKGPNSTYVIVIHDYTDVTWDSPHFDLAIVPRGTRAASYIDKGVMQPIGMSSIDGAMPELEKDALSLYVESGSSTYNIQLPLIYIDEKNMYRKSYYLSESEYDHSGAALIFPTRIYLE